MSSSDTIVVPPKKLAWYRPDIDGLRAVAVLSVVFFHAFPERLPGGYTGVDVFFVISGYLISGIIFKGLDQGKFSFADFYPKRVRRIFPSLFLVLGTTFLLGWVILLKGELSQLGQHIRSGSLFVSNFQLWSEAGYFDSAAEIKPLLHLWSLAIEEQFYLFFPLIFFLTHKARINRKLLVGTLLLLSFGANIALHIKDPSGTFYNPLTRMWEILLGSLLACYSNQFSCTKPKSTWKNSALALAGLAMVLLSFVLADKKTPFPGWFALLPTVGSLLMIAAGMSSLVNRYLLSNPILGWFGKISYPLYLWHWPLLVYPRILSGEVPSTEIRWLIVGLSVALSWLSMRLFENPLRFGGNNRKKVYGLSIAIVLLATIGHVTRHNGGFPSRTVSQINYESTFINAERIENTVPGCGVLPEEDSTKFDRCQRDSREPATIALLGDSKARALSYGLFKNSDPESRVLFIGGSSPFSAPVPIISDQKYYENYQPLIRAAVDALNRNETIKVVIITAATRAMFQLRGISDISDLPRSPHQPTVVEGLDRVVTELVQHGKKVILTTDNPTLKAPPDCISRISSVPALNKALDIKEKNCSISFEQHAAFAKKYLDALEEVRSRHPESVRVFDTLPIMGDLKTRTYSSIQNGELYYSQTDHISDYAASLIGQKLIPFAKEFGGLSGIDQKSGVR